MLGQASGPVRRQGVEELVQVIEDGKVEEWAQSRCYTAGEDDWELLEG